MSEPTNERLLRAAEQILIDEGVHALTTRRIGAVSGLNPALVAYHFGSVRALLAELCRRNLDPMQAEWRQLDQAAPDLPLADLLTIWLKPLMSPAAFNPHGRALVVLDEIASHGEEELSALLLDAMTVTAVTLLRLLQPHIPDITAVELRARLRFIGGAALGPPPRKLSYSGADMVSLPLLVAFARAALTGGRSV
jgi:AcrR family transcriptional regulator